MLKYLLLLATVLTVQAQSVLPDNDILTRSSYLAAKLGTLSRDTMKDGELESLFDRAEYQVEPLDSLTHG